MAATEHLDSGSRAFVSHAPATRWRSWIWAAPALSLLLLVGLLVGWHGGGIVGTARWPDQQATFLSWNAAFAVLPSAFWFAVTLLGDSAVLLPLIALGSVRGRPKVWAATLASVPAGGLMSAAVKHWAGVPRPAAVLDPALFNVIGPVLQFNSFPSGHTISAFAAAAAVLATCAPRPRQGRDWALIAGGLSAAAVVALSRVAVGAHWPLDLAAGAAIGWLAGLSGAALARRTAWWHWLFFGPGRRASAAGLILWGPLLWARPHQTLTCAVVLGLAGLCAIAAGLSMLSPRRASRAGLLQVAAAPATGHEASSLDDQRR
jgi:membrane-associated phospholipid phosphatase